MKKMGTKTVKNANIVRMLTCGVAVIIGTLMGCWGIDSTGLYVFAICYAIITSDKE